MICPAIVDAQDQPLNIVWLSVEDLGPDFGAYGLEYANTPVFDSLVHEGMLFTNAFVHAPVCAVNRRGIITGMYSTTTRGHEMRSVVPLPDYVRFFPEYLQDAGYYTCNNPKEDYNVENAADDFSWAGWDESGHGAHWRNGPEGKPFFAVFNFNETHESRLFNAMDKSIVHDPARAPIPPYYPDTEKVRHAMALYHDNITRYDTWIRQRLDELDEAGHLDNTAIFLWSDHGAGMARHKRWLWDSGVKIMMAVIWPGHIAPGSVNDELVSSLDLAPTVLSLAGVEVPDYMQGRVIIGSEKQPAPQYLFFTRDKMNDISGAMDRMRAVRDSRYKYILNYFPELSYVQGSQRIGYAEGSPMMQELRRVDSLGQLDAVQQLFMAPSKPPEELYDTEADPFEINNLVENPAHRERLEHMRALHEEWKVDTDDFLLDPGETWDDAWQTVQTEKFVAEAPSIKHAILYPDGLIGVQLEASEPGRTVSYAVGDGDTARFQIYTGEFRVPRETKVWAKTGWGASTLLELDSVVPDSIAPAGVGRFSAVPFIGRGLQVHKLNGRYVLNFQKLMNADQLDILTLKGGLYDRIDLNVAVPEYTLEAGSGIYFLKWRWGDKLRYQKMVLD